MAFGKRNTAITAVLLLLFFCFPSAGLAQENSTSKVNRFIQMLNDGKDPGARKGKQQRDRSTPNAPGSRGPACCLFASHYVPLLMLGCIDAKLTEMMIQMFVH